MNKQHPESSFQNEQKAETAKLRPLTLKQRLGVAAIGLTGVGLAVFGSDSAPSQEAPDPRAPIEDVVETPSGATVEIADDKYRNPNPNDEREATQLSPDNDGDGYVKVTPHDTGE